MSRAPRAIFAHHLMLNYVHALMENSMRTTLALDDELLEKAQRLVGPMEKTALIREALKALIERESAKRLALLGGSEPFIDSVPRRRSEPV